MTALVCASHPAAKPLTSLHYHTTYMQAHVSATNSFSLSNARAHLPHPDTPAHRPMSRAARNWIGLSGGVLHVKLPCKIPGRVYFFQSSSMNLELHMRDWGANKVSRQACTKPHKLDGPTGLKCKLKTHLLRKSLTVETLHMLHTLFDQKQLTG